jgi:hypothetical protein|tara:strand:+ start:559 stop:786 length:228 start_codon:yes stop_codon:yes gene_type:complete
MARSPFEISGTAGVNVGKRRSGAPATNYASTVEDKPVRAHDKDGKFAKDDPSTPDVNEAFKKPQKKRKYKKLTNK